MNKYKKQKKISVIIPSVNGLPVIKECLESIYRQKNSDIAEVIVLDWATFFCEYSAFIQPVPFSPVRELPGNNVSYKRNKIQDVLNDAIDKGVWEGFIHQKLIERGYELFSIPSLVVFHKKSFSF